MPKKAKRKSHEHKKPSMPYNYKLPETYRVSLSKEVNINIMRIMFTNFACDVASIRDSELRKKYLELFGLIESYQKICANKFLYFCKRAGKTTQTGIDVKITGVDRGIIAADATRETLERTFNEISPLIHYQKVIEHINSYETLKTIDNISHNNKDVIDLNLEILKENLTQAFHNSHKSFGDVSSQLNKMVRELCYMSYHFLNAVPSSESYKKSNIESPSKNFQEETSPYEFYKKYMDPVNHPYFLDDLELLISYSVLFFDIYSKECMNKVSIDDIFKKSDESVIELSRDIHEIYSAKKRPISSIIRLVSDNLAIINEIKVCLLHASKNNENAEDLIKSMHKEMKNLVSFMQEKTFDGLTKMVDQKDGMCMHSISEVVQNCTTGFGENLSDFLLKSMASCKNDNLVNRIQSIVPIKKELNLLEVHTLIRNILVIVSGLPGVKVDKRRLPTSDLDDKAQEILTKAMQEEERQREEEERQREEEKRQREEEKRRREEEKRRREEEKRQREEEKRQREEEKRRREEEEKRRREEEYKYIAFKDIDFPISETAIGEFLEKRKQEKEAKRSNIKYSVTLSDVLKYMDTQAFHLLTDDAIRTFKKEKIQRTQGKRGKRKRRNIVSSVNLNDLLEYTVEMVEKSKEEEAKKEEAEERVKRREAEEAKEKEERKRKKEKREKEARLREEERKIEEKADAVRSIETDDVIIRFLKEREEKVREKSVKHSITICDLAQYMDQHDDKITTRNILAFKKKKLKGKKVKAKNMDDSTIQGEDALEYITAMIEMEKEEAEKREKEKRLIFHEQIDAYIGRHISSMGTSCPVSILEVFKFKGEQEKKEGRKDFLIADDVIAFKKKKRKKEEKINSYASLCIHDIIEYLIEMTRRKKAKEVACFNQDQHTYKKTADIKKEKLQFSDDARLFIIIEQLLKKGKYSITAYEVFEFTRTNESFLKAVQDVSVSDTLDEMTEEDRNLISYLTTTEPEKAEAIIFYGAFSDAIKTLEKERRQEEAKEAPCLDQDQNTSKKAADKEKKQVCTLVILPKIGRTATILPPKKIENPPITGSQSSDDVTSVTSLSEAHSSQDSLSSEKAFNLQQ